MSNPFLHIKQFYFKQFILALSTLFKCQNSSISNNSVDHKDTVSSIWSIDRIQSTATTPDQSGPGSDGNKGVLCIPQNSSISGGSLSDFLILYPGHLFGESYPSTIGCILQPSRLSYQETEYEMSW